MCPEIVRRALIAYAFDRLPPEMRAPACRIPGCDRGGSCDAQASRHRDRGVLAGIVSQNDVVENVMRKFVEGLLERLRGVVDRQQHRNRFVR